MYWPLPDVTMAPGTRLTVHAGSGANSASDVCADSRFGSLTGGEASEIALYRSGSFASADDIVSYVGWNGGKGRRTVAQNAGIWGSEFLDAGEGATIMFVGGGVGAAAYQVQ